MPFGSQTAAAAAKAAENGGLKLDPSDDPIFAELELLDLTPGTPPVRCFGA